MDIYGRLDNFMRLRTLVFYSVCGLTASQVNAQATYQLINGIKVEAVAVSSAQRTATGTVLQGIQFRAQSGTIPPKFYQRAVDFTKGTTAGSIKNFAKGNAFQLGLAAAVLAMGWAMDELTGQITSGPATPSPYTAPPGTCWVVNYSASSCSSTPDSAVALWNPDVRYPSRAPQTWQVDPTYSSNVSVAIQLKQNGTVWSSITVRLSNSTTKTELSSQPLPFPQIAPTTAQIKTVPAPVPTDDAIVNGIVPQLSTDPLKKLHTDPNTGAVQQSQEVVNKMTDVANEYARELNPQSVNVTAPTAVPIPGVTELPATDTLPSTGVLNFPEFCDWASFLCDEPTEPTDSNWTFASMISEDEIEEQSYASGLGSGSCPSPQVFAVLGTSLEYSYEPVCELAGVAKFFVLLFAYLSSIYILLGIKR